VSETDTAVVGTADPGLPPAPGAEHHPALDLANSVIALPGGQLLDSLGTPSGSVRCGDRARAARAHSRRTRTTAD
jgi:hypothetical protein